MQERTGGGARRAEQVAPPSGWAGARLAGGSLDTAQQTRPLQARCSVTGEWLAGPLEPVMLTLFTPPHSPSQVKVWRPPGPWLMPAGVERPPCLHPPRLPHCHALAVRLSFLGVQGPPCICDSHGHMALHTGHGALPPAGWEGPGPGPQMLTTRGPGPR